MRTDMKMFITLIAFLVIFGLSSCGIKNASQKSEKGIAADLDPRITFLCAGYDEASENTDVLFLASYNTSAKAVSIMQIPRDTYYDFGGTQNKINQFYATGKAGGMSPKSAMEALKALVSEALSVKIDGYVGITLDVFSEIVDKIGGVEIDAERDISFTDENGENEIVLKKGKNLLDGRAAEQFVRYRSGYATGDLGRTDAQKMFLSAFARTVFSRMDPAGVINILRAVDGRVVTDIGLAEAAGYYLKYGQALKSASYSYMNLPGQACRRENGLWYYVANRRGSNEVCSTYFGADANSFDKAEKMYIPGEAAFENIYYDENLSYRVYSGDDVGKINIS